MLCLCLWRQWKREQREAFTKLSAVSTLSAGAHSTSTVASAAGSVPTEGASSVAGGAVAAAVTVAGGDALAMPEGLTKMEQMKVSASEKLPCQH